MLQTTNRFMTRPLYLQLRDRLVRNIAAGVWAQGEMIPNEIALAEEFGVSLGTMRKALAQIEAEGLVVRKQGRGTRVVDQSGGEGVSRLSGLRDEQGRHVFGEIATASLAPGRASAQEARALSLGKSAMVTRLHRLRTWQGKPLAIDDIVLPQRHFADLDEQEAARCRVCEIARRRGILIGGAREDMAALSADGGAAKDLAAEPGAALLRVHKLVYDVNRKPVLRMVSLYRPGPLVYGLGDPAGSA